MSNGCATTSTSFLRVDAVLRQRGEELVLVTAQPDADLLPAQVRDLTEPGVLPRDLRHSRPREDLGDVDDVVPLVARRQQVVQPVDAELRLSAEHDLLRDDVGPADADGHVEPFVLVVPLLLRGVVAGELGLRHPLELERDVVDLAAAAATPSSPPPQPTIATPPRRPRAARQSARSVSAFRLPPCQCAVQPSHLRPAPRTDGCQLITSRSTSATAAYSTIPKTLASTIPAQASSNAKIPTQRRISTPSAPGAPPK